MGDHAFIRVAQIENTIQLQYEAWLAETLIYMALLLKMVSETLSDFYYEHDIRTGNIFILADYYTDLVSSFRFVVSQKNLGGGGGGGGGGLRPTGCLEEFFP